MCSESDEELAEVLLLQAQDHDDNEGEYDEHLMYAYALY